MDSLPDDVVQYILANLSNAKDVASCNCVFKKWRDSMTNHKSLCFPRGIFKNLKVGQTPDSIVKQTVSSISRLEELVVSCPFTSVGLASWLSLVGSSLKNLDLHIDHHNTNDDSFNKLECIQAAMNLESLAIRDVLMVRTPKWDTFQKLRNLEIVGGKLEDSALTEALRLTPNLTQLVLVDCKGLRTVEIELLELQYCKLNLYGLHVTSRQCQLMLKAPKIEYLEVDGCALITVPDTNCLKSFSITNYNGFVWMIKLGELMALESLSIQGSECCWDAISKTLEFASEVKHLTVEIGIIDLLEYIDFVDFFKSHLTLKSFNVSDTMFDALCKENSLKNLDSSFVIPCLEEVVITMWWLSDGEQSMRMIESLAKCGKKLKKMKIVIFPLARGHGTVDDFVDEICSRVDGFFDVIRKFSYKKRFGSATSRILTLSRNSHPIEL